MGIILKEVFDEEGNVKSIEVTNGYGEHIIDAVWDERDEQTQENKDAFRAWTLKMLRDMDIPVVDSTPLKKEV
jgi:hypothetical protein